MKISYLWFAGKDGWQVTSFDPNQDKAVVGNKTVKLFVDKESYDRLEAQGDAKTNLELSVQVSHLLHENAVLKEFHDKADKALASAREYIKEENGDNAVYYYIDRHLESK